MSDPKSTFKRILEEKARQIAPNVVVDALVERPKNPAHGDLSSNIAMQLAKPLGRKPRDIAQELAVAATPALVDSGITTPADVSIAGPGFLNIKLSSSLKLKAVLDALKEGAAFGHTKAAKPEKIQVEFVSA